MQTSDGKSKVCTTIDNKKPPGNDSMEAAQRLGTEMAREFKACAKVQAKMNGFTDLAQPFVPCEGALQHAHVRGLFADKWQQRNTLEEFKRGPAAVSIAQVLKELSR